MTFIKKIFEKKSDDSLHKHFTRFSKGIFENRALTTITRSKGTFKAQLSYDLVKDVLLLIAGIGGTFEIKGIAVKGKAKTPLSQTASAHELREICGHHDFVLVDLTGEGVSLKCKKAVPKPGKSLNNKFATAMLPDLFIGEFVFDHPSAFKKAIISHTLIINDFVVPDQYKNDFALARLHAKRKGIIKRATDIDGAIEQKEIAFEI